MTKKTEDVTKKAPRRETLDDGYAVLARADGLIEEAIAMLEGFVAADLAPGDAGEVEALIGALRNTGSMFGHMFDADHPRDAASKLKEAAADGLNATVVLVKWSRPQVVKSTKVETYQIEECPAWR